MQRGHNGSINDAKQKTTHSHCGGTRFHQRNKIFEIAQTLQTKRTILFHGITIVAVESPSTAVAAALSTQDEKLGVLRILDPGHLDLQIGLPDQARDGAPW
jgi:hypothetical protein